MRILVTGGAGFIGGHLTEQLIKQGHDVTQLDRRMDGDWFIGAEHLRTDCRDMVLPRFPEFVYHLASTVGVVNVLRDPVECIENIIQSTRAVLAYRIPGIYVSKSEVYGKSEQEVYSEDSPLVLGSKARWSYAAAKLVGEWLAKAAGWKVVRLFNVVGPRQSNGYGAVLPRFVEQALSGQAITVYGDGSQVRTFMDVRDCVEILDKLRDRDFDVVNVGGQNTLSIYALASIVKQTFYPTKSEIVSIPYKVAYDGEFEECPSRIPDLTKLRSLIGQHEYRNLHSTILEVGEYVSMGRRQHDPVSA